MPISLARIVGELDQVYCPFTGQAVYGDEGVIKDLPSLLFVYGGNAGLYGHISDALVAMVKELNIECSTDDVPLSPEELAQKLDSDRALILEIDAGWNGVNSYGFVVPVDSEE